jgi:hypothetical protein
MNQTQKWSSPRGPTLPFLLNIVAYVLQKLILGSFHLVNLTSSPTPFPQIFHAWPYNMAGESRILTRATPHTATHLSLSTTTGLSNYFQKTTFIPHERLQINGDSMAIALGTSISHFPHVYLCLLLSHQKLPSSALIPTLRLLPREMFTLLGCSASQVVASTFSRLC